MKLREYLDTIELNTQGEGLPVTALTRRAYGDSDWREYISELKMLQKLRFWATTVAVLSFLMVVSQQYVIPVIGWYAVIAAAGMTVAGLIALWANNDIHRVYGRLSRHLAVVHHYAPYATTVPEVRRALREARKKLSWGNGNEHERVKETERFFRLEPPRRVRSDFH